MVMLCCILYCPLPVFMFIRMSIEKIDSMVYIVNINCIYGQETGRDFIKR